MFAPRLQNRKVTDFGAIMFAALQYALTCCCYPQRCNSRSASTCEFIYSLIIDNNTIALKKQLLNAIPFSSFPICPVLFAYLTKNSHLIPMLVPYQDDMYQSLSYAVLKNCPEFLEMLLLEGVSIASIASFLALPEHDWCVLMIQSCKDVILGSQCFCILSEESLWKQVERRSHFTNMQASFDVEHFCEKNKCFVASSYAQIPKYDTTIRIMKKPYKLSLAFADLFINIGK